MVFKVELLAAAVSLARDPPTIRNDGALDPPVRLPLSFACALPPVLALPLLSRRDAAGIAQPLKSVIFQSSTRAHPRTSLLALLLPSSQNKKNSSRASPKGRASPSSAPTTTSTPRSSTTPPAPRSPPPPPSPPRSGRSSAGLPAGTRTRPSSSAPRSPSCARRPTSRPWRSTAEATSTTAASRRWPKLRGLAGSTSERRKREWWWRDPERGAKEKRFFSLLLFSFILTYKLFHRIALVSPFFHPMFLRAERERREGEFFL